MARDKRVPGEAESRRAAASLLLRGRVGLRAVYNGRGRPMSGSQRALKIICILLIAWAVILIAFGAFLTFGSGFATGNIVDSQGATVDAAAMSIALGIGTVVGGVVNLIIALLGLRGAKNPRKIGAFFVLCIIGVVLGLISLGMSIAQGSFQWSSIVSLALVIVCTVLASSIKKQA